MTGRLILVAAMVLMGSAMGLAAPQSGMEKLLTVAPDDIVFVAGTSGGAELGPAFKQTALGKIWNDPQMQTFVAQLWGTVMTQIQANAGFKDPNEIGFAADTVSLILSRPRIVGAAPISQGFCEIPACVFVIVNAGDAKDQIASRLSKIEKMSGLDKMPLSNIGGYQMRAVSQPGEPAVYWGLQDNYFVLALNDANGLALKHLKDGRSSSASCLSKVAATGDVFSVYADIDRLKSVFKFDQSKDEKMQKISSILTSLGLNNVKRYTLRTGFAGEQIVAEAFVEAPEPRTGLLAAVKPVSIKAFDLLDPNTIGATAMNLDTAAVYDTLMKTIGSADENAAREIADGIARFETKSGVKIREGIIASLAGPVTGCSLPSSGMDMMGGGAFVIIADLKDQARFQENMNALGVFIAAESKGSLQISTQTVDGRTLNLWTIPQLAMVGMVPTWTVVNGKLVLGSSQQVCKVTAQRVASPKPARSLSALPQFRAATKDIPASATSIKYLDSRVYFKMLMSQAQRIWPMATMAASQGGIALPYVLPDLSQYEAQMKPGITYSWTDKDGIHSVSKGSGIEEAIGAVAGGAAASAAIIPSLAKAKQQSGNAVSANKMKELGLALHIYAGDHGCKFPEKLQDLVSDANFSRDLLRSKRKPADFKGPSFMYVAGLTTKAPAESVIVFENPGYCGNGKLNVLFVDGHVEMMDKTRFREELKKTYEFLGQPVPEVRFGNKPSSKKPADPNKALQAPSKVEKP